MADYPKSGFKKNSISQNTERQPPGVNLYNMSQTLFISVHISRSLARWDTVGHDVPK